MVGSPNSARRVLVEEYHSIDLLTSHGSLLGTSASLLVTSALLVVTRSQKKNDQFNLLLIANIVTTSKALVTRSDALVTSLKVITF